MAEKKRWADMTKEDKLAALEEHEKNREGRKEKNTAKRAATQEVVNRHRDEFEVLKKAAALGQDVKKVRYPAGA